MTGDGGRDEVCRIVATVVEALRQRVRDGGTVEATLLEDHVAELEDALRLLGGADVRLSLACDRCPALCAAATTYGDVVGYARSIGWWVAADGERARCPDCVARMTRATTGGTT